MPNERIGFVTTPWALLSKSRLSTVGFSYSTMAISVGPSSEVAAKRRRIGRLDQEENRIHVPGQHWRRRPDLPHRTAYALKLMDQRLAFAVAWMHDQHVRPAQLFDNAADGGFHHAGSDAAAIQRPPNGVVAR